MFGPRQGARQWKQEAASRPALPLECCLAKTRRLPDGSAEGHTVEGRTVMDHSRIAGAVADVLLARSKHAGEIQRGSLRPWLAAFAA